MTAVHKGIARLLDRPGGRRLLAAAATRYARRLSGADVEVLYDGVWMHRSGREVFPDGKRFAYFREEFRRWANQAEKFASAAADYWYHAGRPLPGEVVVDVGAGRGEDAIAFSRTVGAQGRVIAVEAHPTTYALLVQFCRLNRLANVLPVQAAAGDFDGIAMIEDGADWQENSVSADGTLQTPASTLDRLCDPFVAGPVALLKMNIEGGEIAALHGAPDLLARTRLVAVACHDFRADRGEGKRFRTRAAVMDMLASAGFAVSDRARDSRAGIRDHVFGVRS